VGIMAYLNQAQISEMADEASHFLRMKNHRAAYSAATRYATERFHVVPSHTAVLLAIKTAKKILATKRGE